MTTHSRRWKALEIRAAETLGGERVTTPWFLFQERPDFIVADFAMIGDCKAYARFAHHRLLENIQAKYCNPGDTPVLVTAEPHKPPLATIPLDALAQLLDKVRSANAKREVVSAKWADGEIV